VKPAHDEIERMLARADLRYTAGRRRIVEIVAAAGRPVTTPDMLETDRSLPQSSTYRSLDVLERAGVVRRILTGGEHAYFELAEPLLDHHHHLICTSCGLVEDVALGPVVEKTVDDALHRAARRAGFEPEFHSLDLHGRCGDCTTST